MKSPNTDKPRLGFRPDEVAEGLGLDVETVRRWCRSRILRHIKVGRIIRIPPSAIQEFIANAEIAAKV